MGDQCVRSMGREARQEAVRAARPGSAGPWRGASGAGGGDAAARPCGAVAALSAAAGEPVPVRMVPRPGRLIAPRVGKAPLHEFARFSTIAHSRARGWSAARLDCASLRLTDKGL